MLEFEMFGIPVRVEPWFWLTGAVMGSSLARDAPPQQGMARVAMFMLLVFGSILIHELGHALVGMKLGGGRAHIRLWAFGGLAYSEGARFGRWGRLFMILAGPFAGFAFFVLIAAGVLAGFGVEAGVDILSFLVRRDFVGGASLETVAFIDGGTPLSFVLRQLVFINFWWSAVNLLPVFPLDGGQALGEVMRSRRRLHVVGICAGIAMAVVGYTQLNSTYVALLFGYLAFTNYQALDEAQY